LAWERGIKGGLLKWFFCVCLIGELEIVGRVWGLGPYADPPGGTIYRGVITFNILKDMNRERRGFDTGMIDFTRRLF
jgi:hypothetical protein